MITWRNPYIALLACWALSASLFAGEIALQIKAGSTHRGGEVAVYAEVTNQGDTEARDVWIEAEVFGDSSNTDKQESLSVGGVFKESLLMGPLPEVPGIYTVILKVHYEDANGHPYTSLSYIPFVSGMPDLADEMLTGEIESISIRKDANVRLVLTRAEGTDALDTAELRVVLPDEITADIEMSKADLSGDVHEFEFQVHNKSAVAGSIYGFYVIVDYELDGMHRSFPVHGAVEILERSPWPMYIRYGLAGLAILLLVFVLLINLRKKSPNVIKGINELPYFDLMIIAGIVLYTLYQLQPGLLFMDSTVAGGDTAAHNHLSSHLRDQLFGSGRLISWSHGWWCGFPMFQYYFCLPYVLIAMLGCIIPFNIAFKLVCVLGMLVLPPAAYYGARIMKAPKPLPLICAIMMVPYLFVRSHTMWGISSYSTLAGMISNSISFPIMILFISSAFRDSEDGRFRVRSGVLFALLMSSHFFTSIVAALTVMLFPLLRPTSGFKKSFLALAGDAVLGLSLMAWWWIPLIAKTEYSVEFGTNWDVQLIQGDNCFPYFTIMSFPPYAIFLLPFVLFGIYKGLRVGNRFMTLNLSMFTISTFLFLFGFNLLGHVFVNVRLWPFMFYSYLLLAGCGVGLLISSIKGRALVLSSMFLLALVFGVEQPNDVDDWAKWNFEGIESKKSYQVIEDLVMPLDGTAGRLANDLSDRNDKALGSSRVFELVPHLIDKPILEGGIVNSAVGSIFAYYIQSETSENCAGYPSIVKPATFDMTNATKHLELFNVKHFIARWDGTKSALAASPDWRFVKRSLEWELYELETHDGSYVVVPEKNPSAIRVDNWKQAGLDWLCSENDINSLSVLLRGDESDPPVPERNDGDTGSAISVREYSSDIISFKTEAVGLPHLIKCTYYPNWKVRGADKVYMVSPCFMLVYPEQEEVELYYGSLLSDTVGRLVTAGGFLFLLCLLGVRLRYVSSKQSA